MNSTRIPIHVRIVIAAMALYWPILSSAARPLRRLDVVAAGTTIRVQHGSPGGGIILVGYELAMLYDAPLHRRVFRQQTADGDGAASFDLRRDLEAVSMWVAFDITSGAYGSCGSRALKLREAELPSRALRRGRANKVEAFETHFDYVYSLLVRPGVGAWEMVAGDGAAGDSDGVLNGNTNLAPEALKAVGETRAVFDEVRAGDIVAVFVPHQMGYLITAVTK